MTNCIVKFSHKRKPVTFKFKSLGAALIWQADCSKLLCCDWTRIEVQR